MFLFVNQKLEEVTSIHWFVITGVTWSIQQTKGGKGGMEGAPCGFQFTISPKVDSERWLGGHEGRGKLVEIQQQKKIHGTSKMHWNLPSIRCISTEQENISFFNRELLRSERKDEGGEEDEDRKVKGWVKRWRRKDGWKAAGLLFHKT